MGNYEKPEVSGRDSNRIFFEFELDAFRSFILRFGFSLLCFVVICFAWICSYYSHNLCLIVMLVQQNHYLTRMNILIFGTCLLLGYTVL